MALVEQFEKEFFERPIEPHSSEENPEQWVRLLFWQERYSEWLETKLRSKSSKSDYAKVPTIEECYQAIPFPSSERDCAMFVAGIAECHKFISRHFT